MSIRVAADTAIRIAEAIEADPDPGLTGPELDAWNAATIRAANIARNLPLSITPLTSDADERGHR